MTGPGIVRGLFVSRYAVPVLSAIPPKMPQRCCVESRYDRAEPLPGPGTGFRFCRSFV